ncbi:MAG: hypothetical protein HYZ26_14010 [Chloroflexi bacterium]|nr:hypothetical protein [Chloroflexota bacterium]
MEPNKNPNNPLPENGNRRLRSMARLFAAVFLIGGVWMLVFHSRHAGFLFIVIIGIIYFPLGLLVLLPDDVRHQILKPSQETTSVVVALWLMYVLLVIINARTPLSARYAKVLWYFLILLLILNLAGCVIGFTGI